MVIHILSKKLIFGIYIICENHLFLLVPQSPQPRTHPKLSPRPGVFVHYHSRRQELRQYSNANQYYPKEYTVHFSKFTHTQKFI